MDVLVLKYRDDAQQAVIQQQMQRQKKDEDEDEDLNESNYDEVSRHQFNLLFCGQTS